MTDYQSPIYVNIPQLTQRLALLANPPKSVSDPDVWEEALWPIISGVTQLLTGLHRLSQSHEHLALDLLDSIGDDLDELLTATSKFRTHLLQTVDSQMRSEVTAHSAYLDGSDGPDVK